jgi:photosystem II stability/assembly factor-like uncharacterized protein
MSEKLALIIATSQYQDPALRQLVAPAQDAESLARVLKDPAIGGFQVWTLVNEPSYKVSLEIESFCDNHNRDDLLLVYFSCHGIKDTDGLLYFATVDTQLARHNVRRATAVGAEFVNQVMSRGRSRQQILLLDCCYSGAFKAGMLAKGSDRAGAGEQLQGQGRIVLTASDALQYSFEGEQVQGEGARSIFTRELVRGLETGEADLDRDGSYSLDEVYDYVYSRVLDERPEQKPMKMGYVEGKIFIGNNPRPRPAKLPPDLQESVEDRRPWVRLGAVPELERLLAAQSKGLALAAREALTTFAEEDDSLQVRTAAQKCLAAHIEMEVDRGPEGREKDEATAKHALLEEEHKKLAKRSPAAPSDVPKPNDREVVPVGSAGAVKQKMFIDRLAAEVAVQQARREEESKEVPEQRTPASSDMPKRNDRASSRFPARVKVAIALCGILILAAALHWWPRGSWKMQTSGTNANLESVAFPTPQSGWAVGDDGAILHTEDGGGSWKTQTSGTNARLLSVAFATPQSGWAVGSDGIIVHTQDGGDSWEAQFSGTRLWLLSVTFASPRSGWVVGDQGTILHTADGGNTWQEQNSGSNAQLRSVAFATPQSGWAVGYGGTILHTEDGGSTWRKQNSGTREGLSSVVFATPRSGWVVCCDFLHTEDGGQSWIRQSAGQTNVYVQSVAFATAQSGWAVAYGGIILHTEDGGVTWHRQTSSTGAALTSIVFATPQSGWAVGHEGTILHWH